MSLLSEGLVVAHLGQGIAVEVGSEIILCQTLRKLDTVVVGDQVLLSITNQQGRIEQILPRRSVLERPSRNEHSRPIAANIDCIFVVLAVEPECDFLLLDQYLTICENCNINVALIFNKIDLACSSEVSEELAYYQSLGYEIFRVSTQTNLGMTELNKVLAGKNSMFAGQSGVGKSSLTKVFLPEKTLKINSVSETTRHGRHTTTAATLYHLPNGGNLIDSPGVAIFGLAGIDAIQLAWGFREFQPFIPKCRFNDCRHIQDKDCAVKIAVEAGLISNHRYQRYLKLREKMSPLPKSTKSG